MDMMYWFCIQYQQQWALRYDRSITEVLRKCSAQIGGLNGRFPPQFGTVSGQGAQDDFTTNGFVMKAPSSPTIEELLRNPKTRESFRQQVKEGKQTVEVPDRRNGGKGFIRLNIVPAKVP